MRDDIARGQRSQRYYPNPVPGKELDSNFLSRLTDFLKREFFNIHQGFETIYELPIRYEEPERLTEGLFVYADGTEWNPGSGKGVYIYDGTQWIKL